MVDYSFSEPNLLKKEGRLMSSFFKFLSDNSDLNFEKHFHLMDMLFAIYS